MEELTCNLTNWSFQYKPMPEYKKVEVVFLKQECNTAVILYKGEKKRINHRYIYGTLGHLQEGQTVIVKEDFIYDK